MIHAVFTLHRRGPRRLSFPRSLRPFEAKVDDLLQFSSGPVQVHERVFTLPAVEVGSILEHKLEIQYDDNLVSEPDWLVQQPYFVHHARYLFRAVEQGGDRVVLDSRQRGLVRLMFATVGVPRWPAASA